MAFKIPSKITEKYSEVMDEFITNSATSERCKVVYPPKKVECTNCTGINGGTSSAFADGSPNIFGNSCSVCGGTKYKEVASSEYITINVYYDKASWSKLSKIEVPDSEVAIRGLISDLDKIQRMDHIELYTDEKKYGYWKYKLNGSPYPHGFGHKCFWAFLKS